MICALAHPPAEIDVSVNTESIAYALIVSQLEEMRHAKCSLYLSHKFIIPRRLESIIPPPQDSLSISNSKSEQNQQLSYLT